MRALPHLCALALGVGAAFLAGCGDRSNLIPAGDAGDIKAKVAQVQQAVDAGNCGSAAKAVGEARSAVRNLPDAVDSRLRSRLLDGIDRLDTRSGKECDQQPATTTQETVPTTATTAPPETTPTETTPTQTDTTPTDTTPSTPTTPTTTDPDAGGGVSPEPGTTTTTPPTTTTAPGGGAPAPGTGGTGNGFRSRGPGDRQASQGYYP
jgi:hypothetical protein